jgi:hypothetical protein
LLKIYETRPFPPDDLTFVDRYITHRCTTPDAGSSTNLKKNLTLLRRLRHSTPTMPIYGYTILVNLINLSMTIHLAYTYDSYTLDTPYTPDTKTPLAK